MENKPAKVQISSKEVADIILNTGKFEDYALDYMNEIDGKFKCRLKQPWDRAKSGFAFYPAASQLPLDTKIEAIESCIEHLKMMGQMDNVKLETKEKEPDPNAPVKRRGRKPKTPDSATEPPVENVETPEPPVDDSVDVII